MTNAAAVFEKAKKSVVVVRVFDSHGNQSVQGSGVITAENEVTTNLHIVQVAQDGSRVEVSQEGEEKAIVAKVSHIQFIVGRDLCLLSVKGLTQVAEIRAAKDLKVGENVFAIGAPLELDLTISDGIVSRLRPIGDLPPLIQTNADISEGSSGGGLFDGDGKLVGITTFSYEPGQNLNFALPSEWIADARKQLPSSKSESAPQISAGVSLGFLDKAVELQDAEDWNGMLAHCKEWTEAEPENSIAWYALGIAYHNINRHDEIAAYREAVRINPELAEAWNNLGSTYNELDRCDDAIAAHREALRINPELAETWNNLGLAYANLGHYDDAIVALRKALRINSELAEAWYNLGVTYGRDLGRYDDAIDAFRKALRINPEYAKAWYNLGLAYGKLDRHDDAIAAFSEAVRINPEDADAWNNLGVAYASLKRYDDAIAAARETVRINPNLANSWKLLNIVYGKLGRTKEADEANQKYLRAKILSGE